MNHYNFVGWLFTLHIEKVKVMGEITGDPPVAGNVVSWVEKETSSVAFCSSGASLLLHLACLHALQITAPIPSLPPGSLNDCTFCSLALPSVLH